MVPGVVKRWVDEIREMCENEWVGWKSETIWSALKMMDA